MSDIKNTAIGKAILFEDDCNECDNRCPEIYMLKEYCSPSGYSQYDVEDGIVDIDDNGLVIKINE